jgi:hypothetical protein
MTEESLNLVRVLASSELLEQMRDRWSPPVEVMATVDDRGEWAFVFRYVKPSADQDSNG